MLERQGGLVRRRAVRDLLGLWESHVHDEDELEGVVEGEPVDSVDHGFEDGEEGVDDPVLVRIIPVSILSRRRVYNSRLVTLKSSVDALTVSHWVSSVLETLNSASMDQYAGKAKPAVLTRNSPAMLKKTRKK